MRSFSLMVCLFFLAATSAKAQSYIGSPVMNVVQYPTCNDPNGSILFSDSAGAQINDLLILFSWPDSSLIGTGTTYTGLKQGQYMTKRINQFGDVQVDHHFLTNFKPLGRNQFFQAFVYSIFPDTCNLSKGNIRLGWYLDQLSRDTLNMVQWNWSNGQTGLNVTGLKAGLDYWVRGSLGAGCPHYIPNNFSSFYLNDSLLERQGEYYKFRKLRIHNDTLFFSIINGNTLNVGFTDVEKALCETPTGKLTAVLYNSGTPPLQWNWNTGATGATLQNVPSGSYAVNVTDAAGCKGYKQYYLSSRVPLDFHLDLELNKLDSCLFGQGKIIAHVQGGHRPYKYKWNNASLYSTDSVGSNLTGGNKYIQVIDSIGCYLNLSFQLGNQNPLTATSTIEQPNCLGQFGKIIVAGSGGVPPYHTVWAGYPNENALVFDSLSPGYYKGYFVDANGCKTSVNSYLQIPFTCYRNVTLDVFKDQNGDCVKQFGESNIMGSEVRYKVHNTYHYKWTDGVYNSFSVLPGVQDISLYRIPYFTPACIDSNWNIQNVVIDPSQSYYTKSIGLGEATPRTNATPVMKLGMNEAFRPGFNTKFQLIVRNDGNQEISGGGIVLTIPPDVTFQGSPYLYTEIAPNKIRFQFVTVALGSALSIPVTLKLASTVPLSISVPFEISLDTITGETILSDNHATFSFITVGSYDPNDISVYPSPIMKPSETKLDYTIRFQNLGTYYAENVVVIDTLPENIDPSTFRVGYSKHYPTSIEMKGRVLTVRYLNIFLQAAVNNEPQSHGFFSYSVNRYPNLPLGTKIRNSASIYFDFNAPVKTNVSEVEVNESTTSIAESFTIYPNPGNDYFRIIGSTATDIDVFDVTGKRMVHLNSSSNGRFTLESVPNGLYFLRFREGGKFHSSKLIVQKR